MSVIRLIVWWWCFAFLGSFIILALGGCSIMVQPTCETNCSVSKSWGL